MSIIFWNLKLNIYIGTWCGPHMKIEQNIEHTRAGHRNLLDTYKLGYVSLVNEGVNSKYINILDMASKCNRGFVSYLLANLTILGILISLLFVINYQYLGAGGCCNSSTTFGSY